MTTTKRTTAKSVALIALLAIAACSSPLEDKPEAVVGEAVPVGNASNPSAADDPAADDAEATKEAAALATATAVATYALTDETYIGFAGSKIGSVHYGQFVSFKGTVTLSDDGLETARIDLTIDMTSTKTDDTVLTETLKGESFFDVANHPSATFQTTGVSKADAGFTITGNLTIRGIAKSVTFPAEITLEGDTLKATAEFTIDRNTWSIGDGWLSDTVIHDKVLIELDIEAKRVTDTPD